MQTNVVIYHDDRYFLDAISTFINSNNREFKLIIYTNLEKVMEYMDADSRQVDVVIAPTRFLQSMKKTDITKIAISNITRFELYDDLYSINIFQSGEDIVNDLKKICILENNMPIVKSKNSNTKLVSFYSTQGGSGKTTISYSVALSCAAKSKVLYMNLETSQFTENFYKESYSVDLGDILFSVKARRLSIEMLIRAFVKNSHNVHTLPPFKSIGDFLDLNAEDIKYLISSIIDTGGFDYIFIDLSSGFNDINQCVMEESDKVIIVYSGDTIGSGKLNILLNDPYVNRLAIYNKFCIVRNKCLQKKQYGDSISTFPFSQSMSKDIEIATILSNNHEFRNGCALVLEAIG